LRDGRRLRGMTWNRLIASTLAFFALMTGVLAWRVRTGHDPALTSGQATASAAVTSAAPPATTHLS
jgi:hypothetical protein